VRAGLAASLLLAALPAAALPLHIDVAVSVANGRLVTDFCVPGTDGCDRLAVLEALGFEGRTLPLDQVSGQQIFVADFGDFAGGPFRSDNPGFRAPPGGLPGSLLLRYRALGTLEFWDPASRQWSVTVPEDARVRLAGGLRQDLNFSTDPAVCGGLPLCTVVEFAESSTLFTAAGIGGDASLIIDATDATGALHTHHDFQVERPDGRLGGPAGVYLVEMQLEAEGLRASRPFYFMFNRGLSTAAFGQALSARIQLGTLDPAGLAGGISGTVAFGADDANAELPIPLTGSGSLIKRGAGVLVLSGRNTHAGSTLVDAGVLRGEVDSAGRLSVAAAAAFRTVTSRFGSLTGAGLVAVDDRLEVGGDGTSTAFDGELTGAGQLFKQGSGIFTLGPAGRVTAAGGVVVQAGALVVNGAVAGPVAVASGARLGGTGAIGGALAVAPGATVAPGNSIGVLAVGDARFDPGSVLEVEVDAAGRADRIEASGTVEIAGGTVSVLAAPGAYAPLTRYTLIDAAGGVSGRFDGVTSNLAFLEPSLSYETHRVWLALARRADGFVLPGQTANQRAVATWLGTAQDAPGMAALVTETLGSTATAANARFEALAGVGHTATSRALMATGQQLARILLRRAGGRFGNAAAAGGRGLAAGDPAGAGPVLWIDGIASGSRFGDGPGVAGFSHSADGVVVGGGWGGEEAPFRIGAGLSAQRLRAQQDGVEGEVTGVLPAVAVYAGGRAGRADWRLVLGAGHAWLESQRQLGVARLTAAPGQWQAFASGEVAWWLGNGLAPYAALALARTGELAFVEAGAPDVALDARLPGLDSRILEGGLRFQRAFDSIALDLRAGWQRELGDRVATLAGRLTGAPGATRFGVRGIEVAADAAVIGLGLASRPDAEAGLQLHADADARLRPSGQSEYAVSAGLRYRW
jgi:autotransporter-associated beta strand protein